MRLKELLDGAGVVKVCADEDFEVSSFRIHSGEVRDGDLFFCMKGRRDDGNEHLAEVYANFVAVTEKEPSTGCAYILVRDVRRAYALMSEAFWGHPAEGMKVVAVVGTNGKTSTAHYTASILTYAGFSVGIVGTEGHYICGEKVGASLTTPDSFELAELLFKMRTRGVDAVVAEVSAHAIALEKTAGIKADIAVFTNLTRDHLDYFGTFGEYKAVKMSYFSPENVKKAVINVDDPCGRELLAKAEKEGLPAVSYGLYCPADSFAVDVREDMDGVRFVANLSDDLAEVRSSLMGEFNVYNLLAAMTAAHELGVDGATLTYAVHKVRAVKGRFSVLRNDRGSIVIDYAHTPDGLEKLLKTARTMTKSRLIAVFGCGGERDRGKRALMGAVAERLADLVVITSDNPRFEDPERIIADVAAGMQGTRFKTFADRTEAIAYALSEMTEGDTVVIAGKGSEDYLDIRGKRVPYSDFDVAARWGRAR